MRPLELACLLPLLALLGLVLAAQLPARAAWMWTLRVGVPELGWALGLAALPLLLVLGRGRPGLAAGLGLALLVLLGRPWVQAWRLARDLPAGFEAAFPGATPPRSPLARVPAGPVEVTTEEYAPGLSWDRYRPGAEPWARVLFLHGGSWARGTRADYPALPRWLAGRGVELYSASYRLAPAHPFPAAAEDVGRALEVLAARTGPPVVVVGRSAGGHLGLLAAYAAPARAAGVVAFYAPVDMRWSWDHPSHPEVLDTPQTLGDFLGGSPAEVGAVYDAASPVRRVAPGAPPTLLVHGDADSMVFLEQSRILGRALAGAGVPHFLLRLPWLEHGGDVFLRGPTGRLSAWALEGFLRWAVARRP